MEKIALLQTTQELGMTIKAQRKTQELWRKWPNSIFLQIILQSITVSKIYKDLPLFAYSSLVKSSFPWYSSLWNSSTIEKFWKFFTVLKFHKLEYHKTIKNFQNFSEYIFSKNSIFTKSSFKKVVYPYIFQELW